MVLSVGAIRIKTNNRSYSEADTGLCYEETDYSGRTLIDHVLFKASIVIIKSVNESSRHRNILRRHGCGYLR
jgi:hypothetical protein